ncbi:MAG: phosphoglycerate kinase, partial [Sphingomonas sp.]
MAFRTLDQIGDVRGKRVLVREDLNVPMADGVVTDDTRMRATVATVTELADAGAIVLVLAHFGRPKVPSAEFSTAQLAASYAAVLGRPVTYIDWEGAAEAVAALSPGDIALLENTRFFSGEEKNDPAVVARFAALGDLY